MEGQYRQNYLKEGSGIPTGRLSISVSNMPEFKKLIVQAEKEANQLKETIHRLKYFDLNIDFECKDTTDLDA